MEKEKHEDTRDVSYFGYYAMLTHQQNMLQDQARTTAYFNAINMNSVDFLGKTIMDVGAGSGVLSFFAAKCGAKKVFAVEASSMAVQLQKLVDSNNLSHIITVIHSRIEDVKLTEKVDVVISEPIGVFLVHERMIESFLFARNQFCKNYCGIMENQMYPCKGRILIAPFTDCNLYLDTISKARFWEQTNFYGIDYSALKNDAVNHYFSQPIVGSFDVKSLLASAVPFELNFATCTVEELKEFVIPFEFIAKYTGIVHGIAGWFDLDFNGTITNITLSTSPSSPLTHWHQIRFLFKDPIAVNYNQSISGKIYMKVNNQRSYDMNIQVQLSSRISENVYFLQEQQYSYINNAFSEELRPENYNLYAPCEQTK